MKHYERLKFPAWVVPSAIFKAWKLAWNTLSCFNSWNITDSWVKFGTCTSYRFIRWFLARNLQSLYLSFYGTIRTNWWWRSSWCTRWNVHPISLGALVERCELQFVQKPKLLWLELICWRMAICLSRRKTAIIHHVLRIDWPDVAIYFP